MSTSHDEAINPYEPPQSNLIQASDAAGDDAQSVVIRGFQMGREATIRALGFACYLFAATIVTVGCAAAIGLILLQLVKGREQDGDFGQPFLYGGILSAAYSIAMGWLIVALGRGLRNLKSLGRWACIVLLGLVVLQGLLNLVMAWQADGPIAGIGLGLCGLTPVSILGLLMAPSTALVFTADYREAVKRSPSLKPRLKFRAILAATVLLSTFVVGTILIVLAVKRP